MDIEPSLTALPAPEEAVSPVQLTDQRYESFVVRVLGTGNPGVFIHAQVTHAGTHHSVSVSDPAQIVTFIQSHLGLRTKADPTSASHRPPVES